MRMNVKKKRLNVREIEWGEDGMPLWRVWYGVSRFEWERWLGTLVRRFGGDWERCRRELKWRRGDRGGRPWLVGPKVRKKYRTGLKYRWSKEFIQDKINEVVLDGGMPSTNVLAKKLGVHWLTMHRRMKEFGIDLKERKPLGLHGKPMSIPIYINK